MIKVSIIIPTHNSSSYMKKCLDSCVEQTLKDVEIIVVDDCSLDRTKDTLEQYVEKYDNFRAIYLDKNIRQGGARNVGIREAKGEYLAFVDSDDWIEKDMLEKLYNAACGADISGGNYYVSTDDNNTSECLPYTQEDVGVIDHYKLMKYVQTCGMFWTRIYKREFILSNNLFFPEGTYYEDAWFNFMTALYAKEINKIEGFFYHYYQREDSTMHSRNKEHQYERIGIANMIMSSCKERGIYDKFKDIIDTKYIRFMATNILYTCLGSFDKPNFKQINKIKVSIKNNYIDYKTITAYIDLSKDLKFYFDLTMICPKFTVFAYKIRLYDYCSVLKRKIKCLFLKKSKN